LLIVGITGDKSLTRLAQHEVTSIARRHSGFAAGSSIGHMWRKSRFLTPYLRNTLWELGYALDTVETSLPWNKVLAAASAIQTGIRTALQSFGERVLVFAHLSHVYGDGASIYTTYLWRRSVDPDETLQHWGAMKGAASEAILAHGGTISHQHGVGVDHASYLEAEKGELGMKMIKAVRQQLDPERLLNPGKLVE
jgi:alkyldihydroxyacetonephosphate synthase